jgi:hypothetical protein
MAGNTADRFILGGRRWRFCAVGRREKLGEVASPKEMVKLMILKLPTPMNVVRNFCFILYNAFSTD